MEERKKEERATKRIASALFFDTFSLKNKKAIRAVATISKFPRREAFSLREIDRPFIINTGATISRMTINTT